MNGQLCQTNAPITMQILLLQACLLPLNSMFKTHNLRPHTLGSPQTPPNTVENNILPTNFPATLQANTPAQVSRSTAEAPCQERSFQSDQLQQPPRRFQHQCCTDEVKRYCMQDYQKCCRHVSNALFYEFQIITLHRKKSAWWNRPGVSRKISWPLLQCLPSHIWPTLCCNLPMT